jgi:hypothetical protein
VANYELLTAQIADGIHDEALLEYARDLHGDSGSWMPS